MLILGLRIIRTRTGQPAAGFASNDSLTRVAALSAFGSALLLTLANPTTILSFVAIFAGLGLIDADNHMAAGGAMVGSVFLGSILWWVILSGVASRLGGIAGEQRVRWISRTSGAVIVAFGVAALVSLALTEMLGEYRPIAALSFRDRLPGITSGRVCPRPPS